MSAQDTPKKKSAPPSSNWHALQRRMKPTASGKRVRPRVDGERLHARTESERRSALGAGGAARPLHTSRHAHEDRAPGGPAPSAPSSAPGGAPAGAPSGAPAEGAAAVPWFAEDLAPEDVALAMAMAHDKPEAATDRVRAQAVQWEGYLDPEAKRRVVLGDPVAPTPGRAELGTYVAIDCEMVGVGPKGSTSVLARVAMVNWHGHVVYDRFVRPREPVTDYRTWVSGVRARDLRNAPSFAEVQAEVAEILRGRVLVGHALENDLRVLLLSHPRMMQRDTASFSALRELAGRKQPALRTLARLVLGIEIQTVGAAHSPVEDAQATMAIFRAYKEPWDRSLGAGPRRARAKDDTDGAEAQAAKRRPRSLPPPADKARSAAARPQSAPDWWLE